MTATVVVPRSILTRALAKARSVYVAACLAERQDPGDDDECWAEFESLAEYVEGFERRPDPEPAA